MNVTISNTGKLMRTAAVDATLAGVMCVVPALSHMFSIPLYKFNPMLGVMLAGMLLVKDRRNALLMAVVLPMVSMLVTGMPALPKMICMSAELLTIASVWWMAEGRMKPMWGMLAAIVAGKAVYYLAKALIISPATLVGTEWWIQLASSLVWCLLFVVALGRMQAKKDRA